MRILMVIHGYPPTYKGGAELRAERTARALAAQNHEVAVFCIESLTASETRLVRDDRPQDGVLVHRLHVTSFAELDEYFDDPEQHIVSRCLGKLILSWRPDIIHLFSGYLMGGGVVDMAKTHRIPVVVSLTDYWWLCHRINLVRTNGTRCDGPMAVECARCRSEIYRRFRLPANLVRPLADGFWHLAGQVQGARGRLGVDIQARRLEVLLATLNRADTLIAPSHFLAQLYIRYGINPDLIKVWRQGVNLSFCPLRESSPILRFSYLGQIKHHKGVHTLIAAWGQLSGPRLRRLKIYGSSIGEGQYHEQLSRQTQQYEGLTWEGPIRHDEVWGALAETDVLVVPSRWNENSPNVILEAQAMGIPVIGTNLGGIAELVQHGRNGLLFEPDDATDLAAQMRRLLDEPELLGLLSQNPNPFCSFLDEITQIQHLYEQLTGLLLPRIPLEHNVSRALSVLLFWLAAAVPMVI